MTLKKLMLSFVCLTILVFVQACVSIQPSVVERQAKRLVLGMSKSEVDATMRIFRNDIRKLEPWFEGDAIVREHIHQPDADVYLTFRSAPKARHRFLSGVKIESLRNSTPRHSISAWRHRKNEPRSMEQIFHNIVLGMPRNEVERALGLYPEKLSPSIAGVFSSTEAWHTVSDNGVIVELFFRKVESPLGGESEKLFAYSIQKIRPPR